MITEQKTSNQMNFTSVGISHDRFIVITSVLLVSDDEMLVPSGPTGLWPHIHNFNLCISKACILVQEEEVT
jgi:hypothetical protein